MELNSIHTETIPPLTQRRPKCGICRNEITREAMIFSEGLNFGVVCEECYKNNSSEDLELMANLFKAFGGYFGQLKDRDFSLYDMIVGSSSDYRTMRSGTVKLLHKALLHGITPHQYYQSLKLLTD